MAAKSSLGLRDTAKHLRAVPAICQNLSAGWTEEIKTNLTDGNMAKVQALAATVQALEPVTTAISQAQDCLGHVIEVLGFDCAEDIYPATKAAAASLSTLDDALEQVLSTRPPESLQSAHGSLRLPKDTQQRALEFLTAAGQGVFHTDTPGPDDHEDTRLWCRNL
jgi:hypothetical protein